MLVERLFQSIRFHHLRVLLAIVQRMDAKFPSLLIAVDDQVQAQFLTSIALAELQHLAELPRRIDVHHREGGLGRIESLEGQLHHHGRVFANRIEHDRVAKLGRHFAYDVDALGLKLFQVRQVIAGHHGESLFVIWGQ